MVLLLVWRYVLWPIKYNFSALPFLSFIIMIWFYSVAVAVGSVVNAERYPSPVVNL